MQTQRDGDMDVESCEHGNVTNQQQDSTPPDKHHSEQLPVTTDQQNRYFTQDQTSAAHDEGCIQLDLQNSSEPREKSGCFKFRFLCYNKKIDNVTSKSIENQASMSSFTLLFFLYLHV